MDIMDILIAIVGPTCVGKSRLGLYLARKLNSEIVNADSRLVYRFMNIGTDKPSPQMRAEIPHHLIDILNPCQDFSLGIYLNVARRTIADIQQRGKIPLLVGGSGQYIRGVLEGWSVPAVEPDRGLRQRLEERVAEGGVMPLFKELAELDPEATRFIDPRNIRRVIRALEVCITTGKPFSELRTKTPPQFKYLIIGLTLPRDELYSLIDKRVDSMIEKGLIKEVENLIEQGYSRDLPALSSVGYKQVFAFLAGEISLPDAVQQIKFHTHRLARSQYTWFRANDPRIQWFESRESNYPAIYQFLEDWLNSLKISAL